MPIKFSCPNCKKSLAVKDELAGKQGKCPGCKQVVIIPQQHNTPPPGELLARPGKLVTKPSSKSGFDLEAMAAAALSEENAGSQEESATVDFTCPWCDTEIHIPAEFAGKQAPCTNPECKRIVKVPLLKKAGPRDWRKSDQNTMPSGAKRDDAALEGAWDSQSVGGVSRQALVEAAVIKEKREPITLRGWIFLGVGGTTAVAAIIAGVVLLIGYFRAGLEERGLRLVNEALATSPTVLSPEDRADRAELEVALAEYHQQSGQRDANGRPLSVMQLHKAREAVGQVDHTSPQRPFIVQNLLKVQWSAVLAMASRLALMPSETQEKIRLQEDLANLQSDLEDTLGMLPSGYIREDVLRSLTRATLAGGGNLEERAERLQGLIQRGIKPIEVSHPAPPAPTPTAASQVPGDFDYADQLNALAVLSQELHHAGLQPLALRIAEAARRHHKPDHAIPSQLIALLLLLNQQELEGLKETEANQGGRVLGLLHVNKQAEANRLLDDQLKTSTTQLKAAILLEAADVLLRKQQVDAAKQRLQEAATVLGSYPGELLWERSRLLELSAEASGVEEAERLAGTLLTKEQRNRGEEAVLRARIQKNPAQPIPPDSVLTNLDPEASAYGAVVQLLARQNGRLDPGGTLSWAEQLSSVKARPAAGAGAVLGMQDGNR